MQKLGITENELQRLRHQHGFPWHLINKNKRAYKSEEIGAWLDNRKKTRKNKQNAEKTE